jgi:hypothetical protein
MTDREPDSIKSTPTSADMTAATAAALEADNSVQSSTNVDKTEPASEQLTIDPSAIDPPTAESLILEPPDADSLVLEPPTADSLVLDPPAAEPPIFAPPAADSLVFVSPPLSRSALLRNLTYLGLLATSIVVSLLVSRNAMWNSYDFILTNQLLVIGFYGLQFLTATVLAVLLLRTALRPDRPRSRLVFVTQILWLIALISSFSAMLSRLLLSMVAIPAVIANSSVVGMTALIALVAGTVLLLATRRNALGQAQEHNVVFVTVFFAASYQLVNFLIRFNQFTLTSGNNDHLSSSVGDIGGLLVAVSNSLPGLLLICLAMLAAYLYTHDRYYWVAALLVLLIDILAIDTIGFYLLSLHGVFWVAWVFLVLQLAALFGLFHLRPDKASQDQPSDVEVDSEQTESENAFAASAIPVQNTAATIPVAVTVAVSEVAIPEAVVSEEAIPEAAVLEEAIPEAAAVAASELAGLKETLAAIVSSWNTPSVATPVTQTLSDSEATAAPAASNQAVAPVIVEKAVVQDILKAVSSPSVIEVTDILDTSEPEATEKTSWLVPLKIGAVLLLQLGALLLILLANWQTGIDDGLLLALVWTSSLLLLLSFGYFKQPLASPALKMFLRVDGLLVLFAAIFVMLRVSALQENSGNAEWFYLNLPIGLGFPDIVGIVIKTQPLADRVMIGLNIAVGFMLSAQIISLYKQRSVVIDFAYACVITWLFLCAMHTMMVIFYAYVVSFLALLAALVFVLVGLSKRITGFKLFGLITAALAVLKILLLDPSLVDFSLWQIIG